MDQTQEILAALQRLTEEQRLKLLEHAIWESRAFYWRTGSGKMRHSAGGGAALAEGNSPEDVVQEALVRTIDNRRTWDRVKHPEIFDHLKLVVTSLTRNLASSRDNRTLRAMPENEEVRLREDLLPAESLVETLVNGDQGAGDEEAEPDGPKVEELEPGEAEPPEARVLRQAEGAVAVDLEGRVFEAISDDDELLNVYEQMMDDKKPGEIAEVMSRPEKDVYRLTQKLRRRLRPLFGDAV